MKVDHPIIRIENISKIYQTGEVKTIALENINFTVSPGEFVAIMGPSGSGKSTLMHIIGALDKPTTGKYYLDGVDISSLNDDDLAGIRNQKIGFIFQAFNLLPRTTALKNVYLPMMYAGINPQKRLTRAKELLDLVGLSDRLEHTSSQLSGGQQQRVAIARGLSMNPTILLADEPTGNIATVQAEEVMDLFTKLHKSGHTIVMITHEPDIAKYASRTITIRDGHLVSDLKKKKARQA
ncbi:MAG: ABC transporter ATP-binding protein [bacterium]